MNTYQIRKRNDKAFAAMPDAVFPKTRGDCKGGVRPCPWVRCRYHLAITKADRNFHKVQFLTEYQRTRKPSCVLDLIDEHGRMYLHEIGAVFGLTRERVRQIEAGALRKLARLGHGTDLYRRLREAFDDYSETQDERQGRIAGPLPLARRSARGWQ